MNDFIRVDLKDTEFADIRQLVFKTTGISLANSKKELVKRRFGPRLKELGLESFTAYIKYVEASRDDEIRNFCNAITTNLTSFFRENHHYEFLQDKALPALMQHKAQQGKRLRIWSAGCSTGQEAYCLAITLRNAITSVDNWDVKILGSDLDEKCLDIARSGVYPSDGLGKASAKLIGRYFTEVDPSDSPKGVASVRANKELRNMISFNRLNLINPDWPMRGSFDVIFCRNVFIYFDKNTQFKLLKRFASYQPPGSYLCLGHSETISDPRILDYRLVGKTVYVRE